jgi:large repetitive protein
MNAKGLLVIAALFTLGFASDAYASKPVHVSCGQTITENTKLANDLIDCRNEGIIIGGPGITLDLNGHTIDGDGPGFPGCLEDELCDTGVVNSAHDGPRAVFGPGHDDVTIENGSIQGFFVGVYAEGVSGNRGRRLTVSGNTYGAGWCGSARSGIENSTVSGNHDAGMFIECPGSHDIRIEHTAVSGNGGTGIFVTDAEDIRIEHGSVARNGGFAGIVVHDASVRVAHNSISHNAELGVVLDGADGNHVTGNRMSHNGIGVSVFGSDNTITDNEVSDAVACPNGCGLGISVDGGAGNLIARNDVRRTLFDGIVVAAFVPGTPAIDNVVRDNRVWDATVDGFSVATQGEEAVSGTLIQNNAAIGSGDDGFDIRSSSTTLARNTANRNQDLGIEAVPGVVDGGGNRASGNGNPLQCTNVFCR